MEVLAQRLKWLRNKERYSQKEMADKIGMTPSGYQKIELDQRDPKLDVVIKLCEIFNVSADFLLGRENKLSYFEEIKIKMSEISDRLSLVDSHKHVIFNEISRLRVELIDRAKENGFTDTHTVEMSKLLDRKISEYESLQVDTGYYENELKSLTFKYITLFLEIPFSNGNGDFIIERNRPYTASIQMNLFDEYGIYLYGKGVGLGHVESFNDVSEAEQYQENILRRLNGR